MSKIRELLDALTQDDNVEISLIPHPHNLEAMAGAARAEYEALLERFDVKESTDGGKCTHCDEGRLTLVTRADDNRELRCNTCGWWRPFPSKEHSALYDVIDKLEKDAKALQEFARFVIGDLCWDDGGLDGGTVQEKAQKMGLIEEFELTEANIGDYEAAVEYGLEVGDKLYRYADLIKPEQQEDER